MLASFSIQLPKRFLSTIFGISLLLLLTNCSVPGMLNPDSYSRNHNVYAVDFNPKELSSLTIYKMNEGNWVSMGKVKNNKNSKFSISREGNFMIVQANTKPMDEPTYETWLKYARESLGYTVTSPADVFSTVEQNWIYEVDLIKHPLVEKQVHRILMYEKK